MTSKLCAYCSAIAEMAPVYGYTQDNTRRTGKDRYGSTQVSVSKRAHIAAKCGSCGALSVAIVTGPASDLDGSPVSLTRTLIDSANTTTWYPTAVASRDFPDVPEHVARCAKEAFQALQIDAHIAAILMARTTIEATAKSQQIVTGSLLQKIDAMATASLIRPAIRDAAHAIRHLGNDMAHGDVGDAPTAEDATDILTLMTMVLTEVYEAAALTAAIMGRRAAPAVPKS